MTDQAIEQSVQSRPEAAAPTAQLLSGWLTVIADSDEAPNYWSRTRDTWMRQFVTTPGNDLLVGTVSTVAAKVAGTGWYLEGPERTVNFYRNVLLRASEFGGGWDEMINKMVWDYLTQDAGGWIERIRTGDEGAAIGFAALDNAQMWITGNPEYPAEYGSSFMSSGEKAGRQPVHRSQILHFVDMPSPQERLLGVGFCAVSRALTTLMDITRYEREKLSDLPPAGMLLLNNMSQNQWADLQASYDTRQQQRGNEIWRQVMVAFGLDPALPLGAELFQFSQLPDAFDKRTQWELAIYSFALAFRIDPREIWPVSSGTLGTATEAQVMHLKARAKGPGLLLTLLERGFNDGLSLPKNINFAFDFQDTEEDQQAIDIAKGKAEFIRRLWEPASMATEGIVSREEARAWLVREGLFDEEDLLVMDDEGRADDIEAAKSRHAVDMGPRVRLYKSGRKVVLEKARRVFAVPDVALKAVLDNYRAGTVTAEQLGGYVGRVYE